MKNLKLTFAHRLGLTNFLASAKGPLATMSALQRIYDAVRLTDDEHRQIKFSDNGDGTSAVGAPPPPFGNIETQVEDSDAGVLLAEIDAFRSWGLLDLLWVNQVKQQLAAESVPAAAGKRKGK